MVRLITWVIYHLRFTLNLTLMLIFALFFYLKANLCHTQPSRKRSNGSHVYSLFLATTGNVCLFVLRSFLLGLRDFLSIMKVHMSPSTLHGAKVSAALVADFLLVSILRVGDWSQVSTHTRHYFSTYITTVGQHQDPGSQWVVTLLVNDKHWPIKGIANMLGCWAIALPNTVQISQLSVWF